MINSMLLIYQCAIPIHVLIFFSNKITIKYYIFVCILNEIKLKQHFLFKDIINIQTKVTQD